VKECFEFVFIYVMSRWTVDCGNSYLM